MRTRRTAMIEASAFWIELEEAGRRHLRLARGGKRRGAAAGDHGAGIGGSAEWHRSGTSDTAQTLSAVRVKDTNNLLCFIPGFLPGK